MRCLNYKADSALRVREGKVAGLRKGSGRTGTRFPISRGPFPPAYSAWYFAGFLAHVERTPLPG
jgi:hypothetical protein